MSRICIKCKFITAGFLIILNMVPESIEWFIVDKTFSPWYYLAPPPPPPSSPVSMLIGDTQGRKTEKERQLADWRKRGGGGGAKSYEGQKAWSSINHSILSYMVHIHYTVNTQANTGLTTVVSNHSANSSAQSGWLQLHFSWRTNAVHQTLLQT